MSGQGQVFVTCHKVEVEHEHEGAYGIGAPHHVWKQQEFASGSVHKGRQQCVCPHAFVLVGQGVIMPPSYP